MPELGHAELAAELAAFARQNAIPGAAAAVVTPGGVVVAHAGHVDHTGSEPVTDSVGFCIGSVSKTFTAAAVYGLRDAGRLDLHQTIDTYLPEVRAIRGWADYGDGVTLRAVLQHTAGLQAEAPSPDPRSWDPMGVHEVLADPTEVGIVISPGSAYKYSNLGYELLGEVVSRVANAPYPDVVRSMLLGPLAMSDTWLDPDDCGRSCRRARGYGPEGPGGRRPAAAPPASDGASGGWWSTARDLATWATFHLGAFAPQVLADATIRQMHEPVVGTPSGGSYGSGWRTYRRAGVTTIGHGGLTNGFEARVELDPKRALAVVVLVSAVGPDDPAARFAAQLLHGATPSAAATNRSGAGHVRSQPGVGGWSHDVVGTYQEAGFEWVVSVRRGSDGWVLVDGSDRWDLKEAGRDHFVVGGGGCAGEQLVVLRDDTGAVDGINVGGYPMVRIGTGGGLA